VGSEGIVEKVARDEWKGARAKMADPEKMAAKKKPVGRGSAVPVAPGAAQKPAAALLTATAVNVGRADRGEAVPVPVPRQPTGNSIISLLTRKNRQNIAYHVRLGIALTYLLIWGHCCGSGLFFAWILLFKTS
jgi:hypothetical protein